jgi:folate-binding protein YgfZ
MSDSGPQSAQFEVTYIPYGPDGVSEEHCCEIVESFGPIEPEYAAMRRYCGVLDAAHRTVIVLTGSDRLDFLDRMITQGVAKLAPGQITRSFWLNRKGRIVADLLVANLPDRTLLEVDLHAAQATFDSLDAFLFTEDAEMSLDIEAFTQIRLYGPASLVALDGLLEEGASPDIDSVTEGSLGGVSVTMIRVDEVGEPGVALIFARDAAESVWSTLIEWESETKQRIRPIGWSAYNTARIEGGTPLFNVDFGCDSIPHESGLVESRVNFSKGCYLGQEIVARVHNLGHPKQIIRAITLDPACMPVAGAQVFASLEGADGEAHLGPQIGWITSSTIAPMLGASPIAFGMLKFHHAELGASLLIPSEGETHAASIRDGFCFLPGESS